MLPCGMRASVPLKKTDLPVKNGVIVEKDGALQGQGGKVPDSSALMPASAEENVNRTP